jgi:hypothetical protein
MTVLPLPGQSSGAGNIDSPGSPLWWTRRLHTNILLRRSRLAKLERYFDGEFSLAYADQNLKRAFGSVFYADRFGLNWMRLVVTAVEERLHVQGFRVGGATDADDKAWDIWQAANLDELSSTVHFESLLNGVSYVTVWNGDEPKYPDVTVSHPNAAIVEADPANPKKRLAGLRIYADAYGFTHGELFLPDEVWLYKSSSPNAANSLTDPETLRWVIDTDLTPDGFMPNPYGVVPMVPFHNVPQLLTAGTENIARRSELWPVMPVQDAINSLLFNTILVANQQGYRQRYATGLEIEKDDAGNPIQPFKSGIDRLWQAEDPNTKFGEFSTVDITPLIKGLDMLTHAIAAISQVPPHYFSASADRLSGESIAAAETGLVSKVKRKQVSYGGGWEEVMRIAGQISDNAALAKARNAEVIWKSPETRSEATLAQAALIRQQTGVPWQAVMEYLGYSPQEIERMYEQRKKDQAEAALLAPLQPVLRLTEAVGGPGMAPAPDVVPGQGEPPGAPVTQNPGKAGPTPPPPGGGF